MNKEKMIQEVSTQIINQVSAYFQEQMEQKEPYNISVINEVFLSEHKITDYLYEIGAINYSLQEVDLLRQTIRTNVYEYMYNGEFTDYVKWSNLENEKRKKQTEIVEKQNELDKLNLELEQIKQKQMQTNFAHTIEGVSASIK